MGLEEVRSVQTLKFQGGKAPSMFVPSIVPIFFFWIKYKIIEVLCYDNISTSSIHALRNHELVLQVFSI